MPYLHQNAALRQPDNEVRTDKAFSKSPQKPVYIKEAVSSLQGFKNFVRYKFSGDQWYGTVIGITTIYRSLQGMKSSKNRQVLNKGADSKSLSNSKAELNKPLFTANVLMLLNQVWNLFSSRSAIPPEGNSYSERIWDTLKHPERSHEQARYLSSIITNSIFFCMAVQHGFTSKGQKEERLPRQLTAINMPFIIALSMMDMFGPRKKKPVKATELKLAEAIPANINKQSSVLFKQSKSESISGKLLYPLRTFLATWKENPRRVVSLALGLCQSVFMIAEGHAKRKTMLNRLKLASAEGSPQWHEMRQEFEKENGYLTPASVTSRIKEMHGKKMIESNSILKGGIISFTTTLAACFYSIDQLHKGEQNKLKELEEASLKANQSRS